MKQSLAGSLNFACKCIRSGRIYLSRILNFLRITPDQGKIKIPQQTKEDINWWIEFAPQFNGISLMLDLEWSEVDALLSTDSCLTGGGGFAKGDFFHSEFPQEVIELQLDINQLECFTLVVAVKMWHNKFPRKKLMVNCDNQVTVTCINKQSSRNLFMQKCLRELHKVTAQASCEVETQF